MRWIDSGIPRWVVLSVITAALSLAALFLVPSSVAGVLAVLYLVAAVLLIALGAR